MPASATADRAEALALPTKMLQSVETLLVKRLHNRSARREPILVRAIFTFGILRLRLLDQITCRGFDLLSPEPDRQAPDEKARYTCQRGRNAICRLRRGLTGSCFAAAFGS